MKYGPPGGSMNQPGGRLKNCSGSGARCIFAICSRAGEQLSHSSSETIVRHWDVMICKCQGNRMKIVALERLAYLFSLPVSRKVMVPQNNRARICTGRWRSSSVYQIQILP